MTSDRNAPEGDRRTALTAVGWQSDSFKTRSGLTVERWFGPGPRDKQSPFGLNLDGAWTAYCIAVERGMITEARDT